MYNKILHLFHNDLFRLVILMLAAGLPALIPLFHPGFPVTDDGHWMIIRLSAFYETLRTGQFPVRDILRLNHGYGYPVSNFLYPGFLYIGSIFRVMHISSLATIKIIIAITIIGGGIGCMLWLRKSFPPIIAFFGGLAYLYFPYFLFDAFIRGSVGELCAIALLPYIFWLIDRKSTILLPILFGALLISHNSVAFLALPMIVGYILVCNKSSIWHLLPGFGIATFFWLPAIMELSYVNFMNARVAEWHRYILQDTKLTGVTILLIAGLNLLPASSKHSDKKRNFYMLVMLSTSFWLASGYSAFIWNQGLLEKIVQFPFRFLSIVGIPYAYLIANILNKRHSVQRVMIAIVLILISIDSSMVMQKISFTNQTNEYFETNDATTTVQDEYLPKWVLEKPSKRPGRPLRADVPLTVLSIAPLSYQVSLNAPKSEQISFEKIFYPGWQVYVDHKTVPISYNNPGGIIQFDVPAGVHRIDFIFSETPIRMLANLLSILSLLLVLFFGFFRQYAKKSHHH